jgi:hypothetical protein
MIRDLEPFGPVGFEAGIEPGANNAAKNRTDRIFGSLMESINTAG